MNNKLKKQILWSRDQNTKIETHVVLEKCFGCFRLHKVNYLSFKKVKFLCLKINNKWINMLFIQAREICTWPFLMIYFTNDNLNKNIKWYTLASNILLTKAWKLKNPTGRKTLMQMLIYTVHTFDYKRIFHLILNQKDMPRWLSKLRFKRLFFLVSMSQYIFSSLKMRTNLED